MFRAMVKKEFLLVLRDKQALLALFVMPAIFILIMSVAMRDQFSMTNIEFTLCVQDDDRSEMSKDILVDIKNDEHFILLDSEDDAQFLVRIPEHYEKESSKRVRLTVNGSARSGEIQAFKSMLAEHLLSGRFGYVANAIKEISPQAADDISAMSISTDSMYKVSYNSSNKIPNSTQQSVPAWIVFGMFFVAIPMSTIYINERKQNTLSRLYSMNVSIPSLMLSKCLPYLIINQIQVLIMLAVGMYVVPWVNTPALEINGSLAALATISVALSISAIGVSSLIAVSAKSIEQATTIGGILNILLGAIGGVMVPKFIMPECMQNIAALSPMSWGLDGFLDIFLNYADTSMILNKAIMLLLFGLTALILAMLILRVRAKA